MSVGVEVFDSQHQKIIKMINDLADSIEHHHGDEGVDTALREMIEYTMFHFTAEEAQFKTLGYPDVKGHVKQHEYFIRKVEKFVADFDNNKPVLSGDLIFFLRDWWLNHIMSEDMLYSSFFNERGVF